MKQQQQQMAAHHQLMQSWSQWLPEQGDGILELSVKTVLRPSCWSGFRQGLYYVYGAKATACPIIAVSQMACTLYS